jgi:hypothetical protein
MLYLNQPADVMFLELHFPDVRLCNIAFQIGVTARTCLREDSKMLQQSISIYDNGGDPHLRDQIRLRFSAMGHR